MNDGLIDDDSQKHVHASGKKYMPMRERSAQFMPFKTLGRDGEVKSEPLDKREARIIHFEDEYKPDDF